MVLGAQHTQIAALTHMCIVFYLACTPQQLEVHGVVVRVVVVGRWGSGVCNSTSLNCGVFVIEDVQVFSPQSEH